jgi:trans-2,3-dihydro-3-hydroxyanthranilate isomerase
VLAGVEFVHVPLTSRAAVARARFDPGAFAPLAAEGFPRHVYLFAREAEAPGIDLHARMLLEDGSLREDPATGSATACLGAYLLAHGCYGERFALRIEQGVEMGRPSLLRLEVTGPAAAGKIRVGGRVLESARGELL